MEQLTKEEKKLLKSQYIQSDINAVYESLKQHMLSTTEIWDGIFKYRSVPIPAAIIGFKKLFKVWSDNIPYLVNWLSLDGKNVTLDDLNRLMTQISRGDNDPSLNPFKLSIQDLALFGTCLNLYYRGITCLAKLLAEISKTEGFHNKYIVNPKYIRNCEYIFRKSENLEYLFIFEYKSHDQIFSYGINFNEKGDKLGPDESHMFSTFGELKRYLIGLIQC